jgi:hypothetical protein
MRSLFDLPKDRNGRLSRKDLGLLAGLSLLAVPTAADAFNPTLPPADAQVSGGCCDMDQDHTFRGYGIETWDEAPTISELDCPQQNEACLLSEADQISRIYRLQQALIGRAALERAQHFAKGSLFLAGAFSSQ